MTAEDLHSSSSSSIRHPTNVTVNRFTVKGIRSARRSKRNFNIASSWTGNPDRYTTQFKALDKIAVKGCTSAKHVKPNFNTVFSSKDDSEGHQALSHTLNTMVTGNISAKYVKSNFNTVFSSKQDSEIHKTQSQALDLIDGNTSLARFEEQVDQIDRPRRGIKKPTWMNEYVSPMSKASYQI
ncbi:hypothetical protein CTI12_AA141060 [Artemisia annua]|uniref:Uncharacterized protein n=1 Tax=Artemisia annua TaxID=35608 RepID=A0A2U1PL04_ARTAN|nr:hypothetical protein CTI12_AA141060 [Artemisia annua]